ncbi:MAG TPA: phage tail assembly protein [Xanthobacteraceae bacterium]|jgi:hypothetical protein|nr:phage tail assembly protein [Xanthobacteraceae bacterium]
MNQPKHKEGFVKGAEPLREGPQLPPLADEAEVLDLATGAPIEAEAPKDVWPIKVKLMHKPVRANNGDFIHELVFREPTGGDVNRYGNPCHVNQEGEVVILERKMTMMMSALSGILQPFLEAMDPRDWNSCAYRLRGFFLPDPASW